MNETGLFVEMQMDLETGVQSVTKRKTNTFYINYIKMYKWNLEKWYR